MIEYRPEFYPMDAVPARVCAWCGRALCREKCHAQNQTVGVCPVCRLNGLHHESAPAEYPRSLATRCFFWLAVALFGMAIWLVILAMVTR